MSAQVLQKMVGKFLHNSAIFTSYVTRGDKELLLTVVLLIYPGWETIFGHYFSLNEDDVSVEVIFRLHLVFINAE